MRYPLLVALFILSLSCAQSPADGQSKQAHAGTEIFPIQFTLRGSFDELGAMGRLMPAVHFSVDSEQVMMRIGATERYQFPSDKINLHEVLARFDVDDFKSNGYWFNPNFEYMGYMETHKEIDGERYVQKFSHIRRRGRTENYVDMDPNTANNFAMLSNFLNEIALEFLNDKVDQSPMITAYSLDEAFAKPEKVYELRLRNASTRMLPPEIGQLVNMRILNISGSRIRAIPSEIEKCTQLRAIIANASPLAEIPASIGKLQQLRLINFGYCKLQEIPESFGQLTSLWDVSFNSNQLQELPASLANLKNVTMFDIANNHFATFPMEILGLESVGNLWMHGNQFTSIPTEITKLKKLHHFLVDAHEIGNMAEIESLLPDVRIIDEKRR